MAKYPPIHEKPDNSYTFDRQKKKLCEENEVRLIEWPYDLPSEAGNIRKILLISDAEFS